jgi:ABC-type transport system involved in Fe-S cluster assembly fused permease/ATPase subunit
MKVCSFIKKISFILCRVFIVCVVLCPVFRLNFVLFSVMCVICMLCLIVVPLPSGKTPFAVKINNNNNNNNNNKICPLYNQNLQLLYLINDISQKMSDTV